MSDRRPPEMDDPVADALLGAARSYRPPPRLGRRVREALGLPVTFAIGATATTALASMGGAKALLATVVIAGVAGGGGMVAYQAVKSSRPRATAGEHGPRRPRQAPAEVAVLPNAPAAGPEAAPPVAAPAGAPAGSDAPPPAARRRAPVPAAAKAVAPATIPAPATTTPTPAPPSAAHSVPRTLPAVPSAALAAEVDLLNRAQAAAQRRDHRETLARIAEHDRRFPAGALAQEAEVLRIAALFGVGQRAIAAARATRFLERNGDGVLAARVRSMLSAEAADEGRRNP